MPSDGAMTDGARSFRRARAVGATAAALAALAVLAAPADASWHELEVESCLERAFELGQWKPSQDQTECRLNSSATSSGLLRTSASWTAHSTAPHVRAAAWTSASLRGFVDVKSAATSRTFTATFAWGHNAVAVSAAEGAAGRVGVSLAVSSPNCKTADCVATGSTMVTSAELAGSEVEPAGHRDVNVTLEAPLGQTLPAGRYHFRQTLVAVGIGWRVPGATASATADVTASRVTVR